MHNTLVLLISLGLTTVTSSALAAPATINNPAPPVIETWDLTELWHLGGEDASDDEPLLGVISRGISDGASHTLLLDTQLGHVLEIGPDGEYLRTIGHMGEGPGEMQRPGDLTLIADGTLGLVQAYPARVVRLRRDGTPASEINIGDPSINLFRLRSRGGITVVGGQRNDYNQKDPTRSETYRFIRSIDLDGAVQHVYLDGTSVTQWQPPVSDESKGYFPTFTWDLAPDGTMVLAPLRDRYLLRFVAADGTVERVVTRPFDAYRRTREDKQKIADRMTMTSNGKKLDVKKIILDTEPAIRGITVLDDGTIWVESCFGRHDLPPGVFARYDVFDRDGHLRKEVRLRGEVQRPEDGFWPLADGRFMWVRNLTSAYRSMYGQFAEDQEADEDDGDVMLAVIGLARVE